MRFRSFAAAACLAVAVHVAAAPCLAAEERTLSFADGWIEIDEDAIRAIEDFVSDALPVEPPTPEQWQRFWNELATLLAAESIEDLARFKPMGDLALAYLAAIPELRDQADWLRQQADFLNMADLVVRETANVTPEMPPEPDPVPNPPAPTGGQTRLPPLIVPVAPVPAARAPVPAPLQQQRARMARNEERWKESLADRPLPSNAVKLVPRLKEIFKAEGIPPELIWLAEVESSMNPQARSPVGAVGLFQFMPATANRFGLATGLFDERKDPAKSARAAAQYLKILYRQMGSWRLALASYNAGEGRVKRTLDKHNATSFEEIASHLPLETQMYVPKIMAVIALREKVDPSKLPAPAAD